MQNEARKKMLIKKIVFSVFFVVLCLVLELINFVCLGFGVLPKHMLPDLIVFAVMAGILCLFNPGKKTWTIFATIFLALQIILNCVNYTLYTIFGDIFSISMIFLGEEAMNAFSFKFLNFWIISLNILILVIFYVGKHYFNKGFGEIKVEQKKSRAFLFASLSFVFVIGFGIGSYNSYSGAMATAKAEETIYFSDGELWSNLTLKLESFKSFGTYGFYIQNISKTLTPTNNLTEEADQEITDYITLTENSKYNNEFSGVAKGDNLIMIMLESFDTFAIDEFSTPFIYNLIYGNSEYGNALYMENYFSKNKTNVSEQIGIMGIDHSELQLGSIQASSGINMPYSLPNLFNNQGYDQVNYFHSYVGSFYNRNKVNKDIGFKNCYFMEDSNLPDKSKGFNDWVLDSEFVDDFMEIFVPENQSFFSFFTTVSTHGEYTYKNERISANKQLILDNYQTFKTAMANQGYVVEDDFKLLNELIQFKAFCMDTDTMVKNIFERLQLLDILDKTTVVLYADHNCFYSDLQYEMRNISKADFYNTDVYNIPLIIYNDQLNPTQLESVEQTFCTTHDIYPTLCNMFDFTFNSALTQGYSLCSSDISHSVFVSNITGMFRKDLYSVNIKECFVNDPSITDEQILDFQKAVKLYYYKQSYIDRIFENNYFKNTKLFNKYKKIKLK